ncbi:Spy/CpxP family protein refolding chaperone [Microvirga sp. G4-2]|uniref:Spy/CpxP family protein refolding chaperone n=1 Tax=Microvirga sp. G4-2 TaxID=3434467 RepID=UPI004043D4B4
MKTPLLVAALIALAGPVLAQAPADHEQHHPGGTTAAQVQSTTPAQPQAAPAQSGTQMPMGQMMQGQMMGRGMMQGQGMPGGMMSGGMMSGGRGMMGRLSPEDLTAIADAHIAAIHAGLKLSAEQEKLWPPVEAAMHNTARLYLSHMQAMRETRGMMATDPVGLLRAMAERMSQGSDTLRNLADAASPLYATLDEAQKRRLQVLVRMGDPGMPGGMRGMMGPGMMGSGGAMMRDDTNDDDDSEDNR